ncbi:MAG: hypothetical protein BWY59_01245 [Verrucomicrobia bacterium ADurb.Bin345]|nr:MAG: hypothetical protein BWY59_01245 [Verrucomicrobia bacterium ADurb.Bin345]
MQARLPADSEIVYLHGPVVAHGVQVGIETPVRGERGGHEYRFAQSKARRRQLAVIVVVVPVRDHQQVEDAGEPLCESRGCFPSEAPGQGDEIEAHDHLVALDDHAVVVHLPQTHLVAAQLAIGDFVHGPRKPFLQGRPDGARAFREVVRVSRAGLRFEEIADLAERARPFLHAFEAGRMAVEESDSVQQRVHD